MPVDLGGHVIYTGANGSLDGMSVSDVADVVNAAAESPRIVLHFHGGLNTKAMGEESARRWLPVYQGAGAYPIFFVWQSGLLDTVKNNLGEIFRDPIFGRSMRLVLRHVIGLLRSADGQRAATLTVPSDPDVSAELARREFDEEPYAEVDTDRPRLTADDEHVARIEAAVVADDQLTTAVRAAVGERASGPAGERGIGGGTPSVASGRTLLDPAVVDELVTAEPAGERAVITTMAFARILGRILLKVVARMRNGTDAGVYPTVVEELLRGLYLANAGAAVWQAMKQETADTFLADPAPRGGRTVVDELVRALAERPKAEITLVGHSTGAVFIDNVLADLARARVAAELTWPASVSLRIVLLAPAATITHMAGVLDTYTARVEHIRVFTMSDEAERADRLLGAAYPRSLLYLVANVLERDVAGASAVTPVVGLQRYVVARRGETEDGIPIRAYLGAGRRVVFCPTPDNAPPGRRSAARSHTAFNSDPDTLASVGVLVADPGAWTE
jgi:hypothetical protein